MKFINRRSFLTSLGLTASWSIAEGGSAKSKKPKTVNRFADPVNTVCDYNRSFVTHVTKEVMNMARIQIEGRCIIVENTGKIFEYYKFASCKSEDSYTEANLFRSPNYDFSGIYTEDEYSIFRVWASGTEHYHDRGKVKDSFHQIIVNLAPSKVRNLQTAEEIVASTVESYPLVARTQYEEAGRTIILEYPIKTMNVNQLRNQYQTDTGPVPFPDFGTNETEYINMIELVFIAFNKKDQASFVKQVKTPLSGETSVMHYSQTFDRSVSNTIMRVE